MAYITEEKGNEIATQCRKAFEQNAERLAREVPTKIPENWTRDKVQLKKEEFLIEQGPFLKKVDYKVIVYTQVIIDNVNYSAFNQSLLSILLHNDCVYNIKEKKVEKIRITIEPEFKIPFD